MKHPALITIRAKLELEVLLFGRDTHRQNPQQASANRRESYKTAPYINV